MNHLRCLEGNVSLVELKHLHLKCNKRPPVLVFFVCFVLFFIQMLYFITLSNVFSVNIVLSVKCSVA